EVESDDLVVARAEQDSSNRDMERRLRTLEEKMDRLLQRLDGQRGEKPSNKPSGLDRAGAEEKARAAEAKARAAEEKARAREKERAEKAKDRASQLDKSSTLTPEQLDRLKKEIHEKVSKALDPERMKEIQRKIEETVEKNVNPARMAEIQRQVNDALRQSSQQLNEALRKSTQELERAKNSLRQTQQYRAEVKPQKPRETE